MNHEELNQWVKQISDEDLMQRIAIAHQDTIDAAEKCKDSEDHQSCFAGLMFLSYEANERGLTKKH